MRFWLLVTIFVTSAVFAKEERLRADWAALCKHHNTTFELRFKSRSGDPTEDDHEVSIKWGARQTAMWPIELASYVPIEFVADSINYCKGIGAFDWGKDRLLILLSRDDRPSADQVVPIVIDASTGSFIEGGRSLGSFDSHLVMLKKRDGYRILLSRSWHQDANTHGEFSAPDWMSIVDENGRLLYTWESRRQ